MSIPQDIVVNDETAARLDAIANYKGCDDDRQLLELAGFDEDSFRAFVSEIGMTIDPIVERILTGDPIPEENQKWTQSGREHSA